MSRKKERALGRWMVRTIVVGFFAAMFCPLAEAADRLGRVAVLATPDGGIQPQAVADDAGVVHLIYFKGEPAGGDLFYVRSKPGTTEFSKPIRVNSQPGMRSRSARSAVASSRWAVTGRSTSPGTVHRRLRRRTRSKAAPCSTLA